MTARTPRRSIALAALAASTLALASWGSAPSAHAQAARTLRPAERAAFLPVLAPLRRCNADTQTTRDDIQTVVDNLDAGSLDTGTLGADAATMQGDCLAAARAARAVRLPSGAGPHARRYKAELIAAFLDGAQGASALGALARDVQGMDAAAAQGDSARAQTAFVAAAAHMRRAAALY